MKDNPEVALFMLCSPYNPVGEIVVVVREEKIGRRRARRDEGTGGRSEGCQEFYLTPGFVQLDDMSQFSFLCHASAATLGRNSGIQSTLSKLLIRSIACHRCRSSARTHLALYLHEQEPSSPRTNCAVWGSSASGMT